MSSSTPPPSPDSSTMEAWSADNMLNTPVLQDPVAPIDVAAAEHTDLPTGLLEQPPSPFPPTADRELTIDEYRRENCDLANNLNIHWTRCLALEADLADTRAALRQEQDMSHTMLWAVELLNAKRSGANIVATHFASTVAKIAADFHSPGVAIADVETLQRLASDLLCFTQEPMNVDVTPTTPE